MSNFTLELQPELQPSMEAPIFDVITPAELISSADILFQMEQEALAQQKLQIERDLGVLARRAATADFYRLSINNRRSAAVITVDLEHQPDLKENDAVVNNTVADWSVQRDRWNDLAVELMGLCPNLYDSYHGTYRDVFSNLNNPDR